MHLSREVAVIQSDNVQWLQKHNNDTYLVIVQNCDCIYHFDTYVIDACSVRMYVRKTFCACAF